MTLVQGKTPSQFFQPLQQTAFSSLEHASSLKGLLYPFKGKGALEEWGYRCEQLTSQLIHMARQQVLTQAQAYPFALLPVQLAIQTTGSKTAFLRWRTVDRSRMGVQLWDELMLNPQTPKHLFEDLLAIEIERVVLNMQISLMHTIARQARECALKAAHAQVIYEKRKGERK